MEFMDRSNRQSQQHPGGGSSQSGVPVNNASNSGGGKNNLDKIKGTKLIATIMLFSVSVLLLAVIGLAVFGKSPSNNGGISEASYVKGDRYQAVFLNGGQVYFGKILNLNDKYLHMSDIFYLRVNQQVQPDQEGVQQQQAAAQDDISLVKLGCELHRPENEMLINRSQVVFWENLKNEEGENTVPGAVKQYKQQFPEGQECQQPEQGVGANEEGNNTEN